MKEMYQGMNQNVNPLRTGCRGGFARLLLAGLTFASALGAVWVAGADEVRILQIQGTAEIRLVGAMRWVATQQTNQILTPGDRLRTGRDSRVMLHWSSHSAVPVGPMTEIEVLPPQEVASLPGMLVKGLISFFHRDQPGRIQIRTRGALAGIKGTEFVLEVTEVNGEERVSIAVIDGEVGLTNALGSVTLTNQQLGLIEPGHAPTRSTAGFNAHNLQQWCFYYPGVLNLRELELSAEEQAALRSSLDAYRSGDLLKALAEYPPGRSAASAAERLYHAALLLAVGQVKETEDELRALPPDKQTDRLAEALRTLIAAVKREPQPGTRSPELATELLAASYYEQSRATGDEALKAALDLARRATNVSPEFGFAWERVAELEFSFGRTDAAARALEKSLELSPRNAQALALKGFLLAARNHIREARKSFDQAIAVDGALGNAWLGRGLCRIRTGQAKSGREDLLVAAAQEPQRSLLRSYLGKAFTDAGETKLADRELQLALGLDENDPTGWLYSALFKQQQNRVNEAIRDLEKSSDLNDNRALFRSRLLLDQDRAVRSANLAGVYRDAGMTETSLQEAARAVTYDYANDAAHLFISDSFNELRDPTRFNLRQETVWFNELLLANLLAPVGAGRLSQTVTAQEYSKLFEADGLGIASDTFARSDGQVWERASQFGTFRNTSWALDFDYQHNNGVRPNNDLDRFEWYSTIKQQLTPSDTALVLVKYENYSSGDNFQYYDSLDPVHGYRPNFRFEEHQDPIVIGGYQHEWSPGIRTLLLGGRLVNEQKFSDVQAPQLTLLENDKGKVDLVTSTPMDVRLTDDLEIYTAGLSQVFQRERISLVAGALWQGGDFHFSNTLSDSPFPAWFLPPVAASYSEPFNRVTGYGYLTVEPIEKLWLIGGVSYDHLEMPINFRSPPQSAGTEKRELTGPKAAFVWSPLSEVTLRGIYSRSLGGVSLDESYRLEPTQLAGFPQAFRTVISESVVGSVAAPEYDVMGLALDLKLGRGTYAGLRFDHIESQVERTIGVFRLKNSRSPIVASTTPELLDYDENSFSVNLNQLLGERFVVGLNYRLTRAELQTTLPEVPVNQPGAYRDETSWLHQLGGYVSYNHPSGFFARFDARWYQQSNEGYDPAQPGDSFVQLDLWAGYRFWRRKAELSVGLLNLTGQDYHLNPLTIYSELPRERVLAARLSFRF